jgi:hypothetical protein
LGSEAKVNISCVPSSWAEIVSKGSQLEGISTRSKTDEATCDDALEKGMMKGKTAQEIEEVLKKISTADRYMSHGAVIDFDESKSLGL